MESWGRVGAGLLRKGVMGNGNDFVPAVVKNLGDSRGWGSWACMVVAAGPLYGRPAGTLDLKGGPSSGTKAGWRT